MLVSSTPRWGLVLAATPRWACTFQPNLTSLTNQLNRNEYLKKFGSGGVRMTGVPRMSRMAMRSISVLHETPHVLVAGRNYCNGFSCNQFLLVNKENRHAVFIDAADDWPDDWATFLAASRVTPTHVFLTHCHVDNIVNLNALIAVVERHLQVRMGVMWCVAEQPWIDAFPRACARYGRVEALHRRLPMQLPNLYSYSSHAHDLLTRQRQAAEAGDALSQQQQPPQLVRQQDVMLSCATSRGSSFFELGPHSLLHYIFTPGHSPGHMMLSLPLEKLLFTGDVLYYNKVGRVDLPWATGHRLAESLLALEGFPDNTVVLPGHGRLSTLGRERRENRALRTLYERRALGQQEVSIGFNDGYL